MVEQSFDDMRMIEDNQPALAQAMLQENLTQAEDALPYAEIRERAN